MVQNAKLKRKLRAAETLVLERLAKTVERQAELVVREMQAMLAISYPAVAARVEIGWTWGDAPKGAISIGAVGKSDTEAMVVTLYARGKQGSGLTPAWFEFGTAPRVQATTGQATGQIIASPFFYTVYRANRRRILTALRGTLRRTLKKINAQK